MPINCKGEDKEKAEAVSIIVQISLFICWWPSHWKAHGEVSESFYSLLERKVPTLFEVLLDVEVDKKVYRWGTGTDSEKWVYNWYTRALSQLYHPLQTVPPPKWGLSQYVHGTIFNVMSTIFMGLHCLYGHTPPGERPLGPDSVREEIIQLLEWPCYSSNEEMMMPACRNLSSNKISNGSVYTDAQHLNCHLLLRFSRGVTNYNPVIYFTIYIAVNPWTTLELKTWNMDIGWIHTVRVSCEGNSSDHNSWCDALI